MAAHVVVVEDDDGRRRDVVLRRWSRPGWDEEDPSFSPAEEAATLDRLAVVAPALPVPRVIAVDPLGRAAGVPAMVMTRLPGRPPTTAAARRPAVLAQVAEMLVTIHGVGAEAMTGVRPYQPYYPAEGLAPPSDARRPELWDRAIEVVRRPPLTIGRDATFIHRDYHPGNTLWRGGSLTGIVDWESASIGPPGVDLGHLRLNLAMDHDVAVADRAAALFRSAGGDDRDQWWWDIRAFLDASHDLGVTPGPAINGEREERYLEALLQRV